MAKMVSLPTILYPPNIVSLKSNKNLALRAVTTGAIGGPILQSRTLRLERAASGLGPQASRVT